MERKYQPDLCESDSSNPGAVQLFVLLHSPSDHFLFGDGSLDWLTDGLMTLRINGKMIMPLTPQLCVYFCTPQSMRSYLNCISMVATPWIVDRVNEVTQIYSRDRLFFLGKVPILTDAFRQQKFLRHGYRQDSLIDYLEHTAGIK